MESLWDVVQGSAVSAALRSSLWVYPLVNAGHLLGIALLIGAVVPMDLRVLGLWQDVPVSLLERVLRPVALYGLALALTCGVLLFVTRPLDYADAALFRLKMIVLFCALTNAAIYLWVWRRPGSSRAVGTRATLGEKAVAGLSLLLWLLVLLCGRLIAYR